MRKDYIPVSDADSSRSESAFVEDYWTRMWDGRSLADAARTHIENREEFKWMDPYLSQLPPNSRILDGGCGLGEWTLYYTARGFETVGLDLSRATIERLKSRFPNHHFVVGDLRNTQFADGCFDAYFSWGTFEHFEEGLGTCLREAQRILKPEGHLFVSVPFHNGRHRRADRRELWQLDKNYDKEKGYKSLLRFYQWRLTKYELQRELELNGFRPLKVQPIHKLEGIHRMVEHDVGIPRTSLLHKVAVALFYPFVSTNYVGHMILGIGRRSAA